VTLYKRATSLKILVLQHKNPIGRRKQAKGGDLDKVCELGISVDHQAMHLKLAVKHKKLLSCQY
jgi:hypothetical protein